MAVIACKLIVEHKLLREATEKPKPPPPDPFGFGVTFQQAVENMQRQQREAEMRPPKTSSAETPRKVLLSQPIKCARCLQMIPGGSFSCWNSVGAVYHVSCWDSLQAEKDRKSWNP